MKIRLNFLVVAILAPNISWADTSNCYSIKDSDLKNSCLAVTKNEKSRCYAIKGRDLKNICLAQVGKEKSRCYSIKDRDQKHVFGISKDRRLQLEAATEATEMTIPHRSPKDAQVSVRESVPGLVLDPKNRLDEYPRPRSQCP